MWEAPTTMKTSLFIVIITLPILTTSILIGLQPRTATALPSWERFVYVCFFYAWGFVCVCLGMCVCKRVIDANSRHLSVPHLKIPGLFFHFFLSESSWYHREDSLFSFPCQWLGLKSKQHLWCLLSFVWLDCQSDSRSTHSSVTGSTAL